MKTLRLILLAGATAITSAAFAGGCSGTVRSFDDGLGAVGDVLDQGLKITRAECNCSVARGEYTSVEACVQAESLGKETRDCIAQIYADGGGQPSAECELPILRDLQTCIELSSCSNDLLAKCYSAYSQRIVMCPSVPYVAQSQAAQECQGYSLGPPFLCGNGREIPESSRCDRFDECGDRSDEANCYACMDASAQLSSLQECDGVPQCADGSDEQACFQCASDGLVIIASWVCDEYADCADGSDEANCAS